VCRSSCTEWRPGESGRLGPRRHRGDRPVRVVLQLLRPGARRVQQHGRTGGHLHPTGAHRPVGGLSMRRMLENTDLLDEI